MGKLNYSLFITLLATIFLSLQGITSSAATETDYTHLVSGADGSDLSCWYVNEGVNGQLQFSNSGRGSRDGSNMSQPFPEYWLDASSGQTLDDAEIRHTQVSGLPVGRYRLTMRIRCYDERGQNTPDGAWLYANGVEANATSGEGIAALDYNGQPGTYGTVSVTFTVGDDGMLDFGINVRDYNATWVAWKDVRLYYDESSAPAKLKSGDYYLRHKSTGRWLGAGGHWGTQAVFAPHGIVVHATPQNDDSYLLTTDFNNDGLNGLGANGNELFVEVNAEAFTITPTADGCFTIQGDRGYLGFDGNNSVSLTLADGDSDDAQWQFLTWQQMTTELLAGGQTDATFFISNPRFDRHSNTGDWEGSSFGTGGEEGDRTDGNFCAEVWNTNFDVSQTLVNIPNGRYRLTVQGYYRYNDNWNNYNYRALVTHNDGTERLYALLYANGGNGEAATPLQSIATETDRLRALGIRTTGDGMPYSMTEASHAFSAGLYADNAVEVEVTSHQLTIGIRKEQQDGCDWTIWDNFELTLLSLGDNAGYDPGEEPSIDDIDFSQATPDTPVDCTPLIQNADFRSTSGWQGSPKTKGASGQKVATMGQMEGKNTFDVYQTISDLPNGLYKLTAQGFYRYGDITWEQHDDYGWHSDNGNNVWAMYTIPYATISHREGFESLLAKLYGNNAEVGLPSIFDYAHESYTHNDDAETEFGWVPGSASGAAQAFADGEYGVELTVAVTDGTLRLGVRKSLGYKYDWACWSNLRLYYLGDTQLTYATDIDVAEDLSLTLYEKRQLAASVLPADATDQTLRWSSSDTGVVEVDQQGHIRAAGTGMATIYVTALGADGAALTKGISVSVADGNGDASQLVINELQVSNLDMFLDPSNNYGAWLEFYNPTDRGVSLRNLYVSDDSNNPQKFRLNSQTGAVPPKGFAVIWFDHNESCSSNVSFKPDMDGGTIYLSDQGGNILTSYTWPKATPRTAFARMEDGVGNWGITAHPTPGASNAGSAEILSLGTAIETHIPVDLSVYRPSAAEIQDISSKTGLPVLSVIGDPKHFYSDETGIFVTGTNGVSGSGVDFACNWNQEWDRPVHMEYFVDGQSVFAQECNISRFGGWSRSWFPYNFKLKAQKQYGENYFEYPFFQDNKPYLKHKVLQVRNGGNDLNCRIKDAAIHRIIITSGFYLDCQDCQPACVFINGRYIGMLNLREPSNKHFALANYGIDTDEMDQMEVTGWVNVKAGSSEAFDEWQTLAANASDEDVYRQIGEKVDIDEFINYMAAELYLGGDDWPGNNCKVFKGWDGKFHVVFFDVDQTLRYDRGSLNRITNANEPLMRIFRNMLGNQAFCKQFVDSYCLFGGSVMEPERCHDIIDRMSEQMNPALALEGLSTDPTAGYMKDVLNSERQQKMIQALAEWPYTQQLCTAPVNVTVATDIEDGKLQVNGLDVPTNRFAGTLFAPAVLKASAPQGYVFRGWSDGEGNVVSESEELDISAFSDITLTAHYERLTSDIDLVAAIAMPIKVNEVSAGNTIFANEQWKRSDWIELFNNTDYTLDAAGLYLSDDANNPLKYQIPASSAVNTILPPGGHLVVWADDLNSQTQVHTGFKLSNSQDQVVLVSSSDLFVANNAEYFKAHPGLKTFVDGLTYSAHRGDQSIVRFPDGGRRFYQTWRPTIERTNTLLTGDEQTGEDQLWMLPGSDNFTLQLAEGWNWISHTLETPVGRAALSSHSQRLLADRSEAFRDTKFGLVGTLKTLEAGHLYKVLMNEPDVFSSDANHCDTRLAIALQPGWNWIGYTADGAQAVAQALAATPADEGDVLLGYDDMATFTDGAWSGSLTTVETGKGYMYKTGRAKTLRFTPPVVQVRMDQQRVRQAKAWQQQRYGLNSHGYPNVMGVIARVELDGQPVAADRLTLLAYDGDECRGVAKWVGDLAWINIYGDGGETIAYRAIDHEDGTVYTTVERNAFTADVAGTPHRPVVLTLTEAGAAQPTEASGVSAVAAKGDKRLAGYYSLGGTLVGYRAATLPPGIYLKKLGDGSCRKVTVR